MEAISIFPFGQPVRFVIQQDRTPKRVFVLGVYASAVHARWIGPDMRTIVHALAVASEPYIFWRGEGAEEILRQITVPPQLGRLECPDPKFNGPSGQSLDDHFLKPLGLRRDNAWLCDLVPHSCMNAGQQAAIERAYLPHITQYHLPTPTVTCLPQQLSDASRRAAIQEELGESRADILILLGDQPIRWFLRFFDATYSTLSMFGTDPQAYGQLHPFSIAGKILHVLPLAHPRQVSRLGSSSRGWYNLHRSWETDTAPTLLGKL